MKNCSHCGMSPERCRAKQHREAAAKSREWRTANPNRPVTQEMVTRWLFAFTCCPGCQHI